MKAIEMSNQDFDTLIRWIGMRCFGGSKSGIGYGNLERRSLLILKKLYRKYGSK